MGWVRKVRRMRRIYRVHGGSATPSRLAVADVSRELRVGGLALLPTETVYGVGVSVAAFSDVASVPAEGTGYRRIFSLKRRDLAQTVPWLVGGPEALDEFGRDVAEPLRALAREFWPGALTIVVPAAPSVPAFMQAGDGTVALRMSSSPVILAIARALGSPLAVTSANTHGMPAPVSFTEVEPRILDGVDVSVDAGATACREASTIVAMTGNAVRVIRVGALPPREISRALAEAGMSSASPKQMEGTA